MVAARAVPPLAGEMVVNKTSKRPMREIKFHDDADQSWVHQKNPTRRLAVCMMLATSLGFLIGVAITLALIGTL